jgi:putative restriction endonuclease
MDKKEILNLVSGLNVWKRGDQRAPHKPLLLLYALGRCLRDEKRLIPFEDVDEDLKKLLLEFGPPRKSYHPEYPFWRLQNDGLWEIPDAEDLHKRKPNCDVPKSELLKNNAHGGLKKDIHQLLCRDRQLLAEMVSQILNANFPASIHEDILQAVGIDLEDTYEQPPLGIRHSDIESSGHMNSNALCAGSMYASETPLWPLKLPTSSGTRQEDRIWKITALPCAPCTTSCLTGVPLPSPKI